MFIEFAFDQVCKQSAGYKNRNVIKIRFYLTRYAISIPQIYSAQFQSISRNIISVNVSKTNWTKKIFQLRLRYSRFVLVFNQIPLSKRHIHERTATRTHGARKEETSKHNKNGRDVLNFTTADYATKMREKLARSGSKI